MKISVTYNFPDGRNHNGVSLEEDCTVSLNIENVMALHINRVLSELADMSVKNLAKLGSLTAFSWEGSDVSDVESRIIKDCTLGQYSD